MMVYVSLVVIALATLIALPYAIGRFVLKDREDSWMTGMFVTLNGVAVLICCIALAAIIVGFAASMVEVH